MAGEDRSGEDPSNEIPQQKEIVKSVEQGKFLMETSELLGVHIEKFQTAKRLHGEEKEIRDLLVYFLWDRGVMTNEEIGKIFGFSYSSVSHIVKDVNRKMKESRDLRLKYQSLNSQFKM